MRDSPFTGCRPERLLTEPIQPIAMSLLAVAHETTADQVGTDCEPAVHLWHHMIERGTAAKRISAVGAFVVPGKMDLITSRAPSYQATAINVGFVH